MKKFEILILLIFFLPALILGGGYLFLENRIKTMQGIHLIQTVASMSASLPMIENTSGDRLEITRIDPMPPAVLKPGEKIKIEFNYSIKSAGQACVFAKGLINGEETSVGGGSSGSPTYTGTSSGEYEFMKDDECDVNEIQVFMCNFELPLVLYTRQLYGPLFQDQNLRMLTMKIPVDLKWRKQ
ncbi:MAG: hypothetical protein ACOYXC_16410 [Candidatus Rifleibacteriota bacterium]